MDVIYTSAELIEGNLVVLHLENGTKVTIHADVLRRLSEKCIPGSLTQDPSGQQIRYYLDYAGLNR